MWASGQRETRDEAGGMYLLTLAAQPQTRLSTFLGLTVAHIYGGNVAADFVHSQEELLTN